MCKLVESQLHARRTWDKCGVTCLVYDHHLPVASSSDGAHQLDWSLSKYTQHVIFLKLPLNGRFSSMVEERSSLGPQSCKDP